MSTQGPETDPFVVAAKERAAALVGQVISDRYRIIELVAMGGMGAVYRGEHLRMRKRVAIKVLHPDVEGLPELVARFEREAVAGAQLQHANAAAAMDFGELNDGSTYLVLEYVAGRTLHAAIREEAPFDARRVVHIARQLAGVLGAAHAAGLVHRDVKPRNVMLVEGTDDVVKLIDFGLAKVSADRLDAAAVDERGRRAMGPLTGEGTVLGTVAYLAPEAALGMAAVTPRSDLYALGLILYEMLTGKHPFDAKEPGPLFRQQRFDPPPPMRERGGVEVPPKLEAVARRLLSKNPTDRHATGQEVVAALDEALASATTQPPSPPAAREPSEPPEPLEPSPSPSASVVETLEASRPAPRPRRVPRALLVVAVGGAIAGYLALFRAPPASMTAPTNAAVAKAMVAVAAAPTRSAPPTSAAPAPDAPASATPAEASTPAAPAAVASVATADEVRVEKATLIRAAEVEDWRVAEASLLALAKGAPATFAERATAGAARDVATALEREGRGRADAVFDALATAGDPGHRVLYDLVESRGGSLAAKRASATLLRPEILASLTPALRVAFELRVAPCNEKLALLDRAAADGDDRALVVLEGIGRACFVKNRQLEAAIKALRGRLEKAKPE